MQRWKLRIIMGGMALVSAALSARADVSVACPIGDHMVLQRGKAAVWGKADPGEAVTVAFRNARAKAVADDTGAWRVELATGVAGGPFDLTLTGKNTLVITDVLVGEVWLGSGQSNMNMALKDGRGGVLHAAKEIEQATYPTIRFLQIANGRDQHEPKFENIWTDCNPKTAHHFSAALYFFARRVQGELNIPIGVINASQGGTPIQGWLYGKDRYQKCIANLVPFSMRGAMWYQGESNVGMASEAYRALLEQLVLGWRKAWGEEFYFYTVLIAPSLGKAADKQPLIWEAECDITRLPKTGLVSTSDIGNLSNLHPANKQDLGLRLAHLALVEAYGVKGLAPYSPSFAKLTVKEGAARVAFAHAEGGLVTTDGAAPDWFEVAGADKVFHWAQARIDGADVVLTCADVAKPVAARFAWCGTAEPNLVGKASGLPVLPFRSERWDGVRHVAAAGPLALAWMPDSANPEAVFSALKSQPAQPFTSGGRILGEVRLAANADHFGFDVRIDDATITSAKQDWAGVSVDFYLSQPEGKTVRQLVFVPTGAGETVPTKAYEMGKEQKEKPVSTAHLELDGERGYRLVGFVPLEWFGVKAADGFRLEVAVSLATKAGAVRSWRSLFGSIGAFNNNAGFRAVAPIQAPSK